MRITVGQSRVSRRCLVGCLAAVVTLIFAGVSWAQPVTPQKPTLESEPTPNKALRDNFPRTPTAVVVRGWVTMEEKVPDPSVLAYQIKDNYGDLMLIRTTKTLPGVNSEVKVLGVALFNSGKNPYVLEEERRILKLPAEYIDTVVKSDEKNADKAAVKVPGADGSTTSTAGTPEVKKTDPIGEGNVEGSGTVVVTKPFFGLTWPWIIGLGVLGAGLIIGAIALVMTRKKEGDAPGAQSSDWQNPYVSTPAGAADVRPAAGGGAAVAEAAVVEDFKTVKAYKTTKVLPGRLIVVENQRETDVIHLSDQSGRGEIEIGRDSPDATGGIRIKDKTNTLSRHQAKLIYSSANHDFSLLNLIGEGGNPTAINGKLMRENEAIILKDGDVITMGSVELMFRPKAK